MGPSYEAYAVAGFSKGKKGMDDLAGVGDWTMDDLRRSFATHCTEQLGVDPVVVDRILNHVSGAVRSVAARVPARGVHGRGTHELSSVGSRDRRAA